VVCCLNSNWPHTSEPIRSCSAAQEISPPCVEHDSSHVPFAGTYLEPGNPVHTLSSCSCEINIHVIILSPSESLLFCFWAVFSMYFSPVWWLSFRTEVLCCISWHAVWACFTFWKKQIGCVISSFCVCAHKCTCLLLWRHTFLASTVCNTEAHAWPEKGALWILFRKSWNRWLC
jgi:hypothetical protein